MPLPLSPSTTYTPGAPPSPKAQDLNDLQKYEAGLYTGVYTVASLQADGTGGAASAAVAGQILSSAKTTKSLWLPASGGLPVSPFSGGWHVNSANFYLQSTSISDVFIVPVPTRFMPATARGTAIQAIAMSVKPGGTGATQANLIQRTGLSTYGGSTAGTDLATVSADGTTNLQQPSANVSAAPTADADFVMQIVLTAFNAGDIVYGFLLTFQEEVY